MIPAVDVLQRHLRERAEMDAAAKLRKRMEHACDVECHAEGTRACLPTGECQCRNDFVGTFCEKCRDERKFIGSKGSCEVCPCPLNRSSGHCYYEPQLARPVCRECRRGFGGYQCELCAVNYRPVNGTCLPGEWEPRAMLGTESCDQACIAELEAILGNDTLRQEVAGSLSTASWGGLSPAGARVALSLSIPLSVSVLLLCGLVCFLLKRRQRVSRLRKGQVSEDKLILFHQGHVTINDAAQDDYSDDDLGFGAEMRRSAALRPTLVNANGQVKLSGDESSEEEDEGLLASPTIRRERNSYYFLAGEAEALAADGPAHL